MLICAAFNTNLRTNITPKVQDNLCTSTKCILSDVVNSCSDRRGTSCYQHELIGFGLSYTKITAVILSSGVAPSFFTKLAAGVSRLPIKYRGTDTTTCLGEGPTSRLIQRRASNPPWRNFQPVGKVTLRTMPQRVPRVKPYNELNALAVSFVQVAHLAFCFKKFKALR